MTEAKIYYGADGKPLDARYTTVQEHLSVQDLRTLKVEETEAVVKGQTAASSYKPALLTGGIKTSVPPFITTEDFVIISTADSSYIEKAKK